MSDKQDRSGEFDLIEKWFAPLAAPNALGLKDDAASFSPPEGFELVVTHDTILQDIHFLAADPPDLIAKKALRVNLSDLYAKGAAPLGYTLSLGLPDRWQDAEVSLFAKGLHQDHKEYDVALFGGDTYRSPERLCVGIAMIGQVRKGEYVSRLGAAPGQIVAVTGTIGDAALGLDACQGRLDLAGHNDWLARRYRVPRPPKEFAELVSRFATASMDISDGLLGDLAKLCGASGIAATVERQSVPLSAATKTAVDGDGKLWDRVLTGGDDYQVLFTVRETDFEPSRKAAQEKGIVVTAIGKTIDGPAGAVALQVSGKPVDYEAGSYSHF